MDRQDGQDRSQSRPGLSLIRNHGQDQNLIQVKCQVRDKHSLFRARAMTSPAKPIPRSHELQRRHGRSTSSFCAVLCLAICLSAPIAAGDTRRAEKLYETAMAQVGHVSANESIKAFQRVLKADPDYAPAHYEIAKLYTSLDTPMDRYVAMNAVNTAIRLNKDDVTYRVFKADILWTQGSWYNAVNEYKKVMKLDPKNAKAAYMIGRHGIRNFMKYNDKFMMNGILGFSRREHTRTRHSWSGFGIEELDEAVSYLKKCIEADPPV